VSVVLERERTAPAASIEFDLLDDNGRLWRVVGPGRLTTVTRDGRVDPLDHPVSVEAVELLCGPLRPVPAVIR
jgi:hypothetical protein